MRGFTILLTIACVVPRLSAYGQVPAAATAMLQRIFASGELLGQFFGPARWIENGNAYTTVERSPTVKDGVDIVRYGTATGDRSVYVAAESLIPAGAAAPLEIDGYSWSADGT